MPRLDLLAEDDAQARVRVLGEFGPDGGLDRREHLGAVGAHVVEVEFQCVLDFLAGAEPGRDDHLACEFGGECHGCGLGGGKGGDVEEGEENEGMWKVLKSRIGLPRGLKRSTCPKLHRMTEFVQGSNADIICCLAHGGHLLLFAFSL